MKHTISVLVENHFGVLARIASLFSARGYNIDSLCVGETENPEVSRMTVVVRGDDSVIDQIIKQLNKVADTIEVSDLTRHRFVERELVLIKVQASGEARSEALEIAGVFRATTVDISAETITFELTGSESKVEAFIDMMRAFSVQELVRTGEIAMNRAARTSQP
ncbi:MAG TPA: acetolactate synthase small subunit [Candidatus Hydrogenedentes bacterium]|nr:acetolactate synthase small subunit [Candidatus Hydrogenedentota bacterium]HPG68554.1 acetolactate synthase small subunit [Candidatus Hydrogenedentota bacterium]